MQTVTLFSLFILGLSYGATACMFSCMPFLTPILINNSNNVRESLSIMLPFSLGRIFSYTIIAMLSLSGAAFIKAILGDTTDFQIVLGGFTTFMGLSMLYSTLNKRNKSCSSNNSTLLGKLSTSRAGLFGIGILISISPCSAIMTLVAMSANGSSFFNAASMGISFGLGAVLVPFLFYGFFLSTLMRGLLIEFKSYAKAIEIGASLLLITVGILVLNSKITF